MAGISLTGTRLSAEIIDISVYSISFKIKAATVLKNILNKNIGIIFYIPNHKGSDASIKIEEKAVVIHQSKDKDNYYKIICIFDENRKNEDILIEYVYNRQLDIIKEMKELS
jgi:hypothetical protein